MDRRPSIVDRQQRRKEIGARARHGVVEDIAAVEVAIPLCGQIVQKSGENMATHSTQLPSDPAVGIFPSKPTPGALGVFTRLSKVGEITQLEVERKSRVWEVRAHLSDHVPLAGTIASILERSSHHLLHVNPQENPLWIYLHKGGRNVVYFGLFNDDAGKLDYISVKVQTILPSNAVLLARGPINTLLDLIARNQNMPLVIQRLDLMSPTTGDVLLSEGLVPEPSGIVIGPLGGIMQETPFAPYEALYREAITNPSPFYRLLCAWKMYEGTGRLRRWARKESKKHGVVERIPADPQFEEKDLIEFGFDRQFVKGITSASQLFEKLRQSRNAISHFLIDTKGGEALVYLADGKQLRHYSISAAALLYYSQKALQDLRLFCINRIQFPHGSILPMIQDRDQFVVRAADHGMI